MLQIQKDLLQIRKLYKYFNTLIINYLRIVLQIARYLLQIE